MMKNKKFFRSGKITQNTEFGNFLFLKNHYIYVIASSTIMALICMFKK